VGGTPATRGWAESRRGGQRQGARPALEPQLGTNRRLFQF